ncbi:DUF4031 domain-containing protein [Curtobacterium luteum]|uniref:DUF4031 domain-containing protein n=1 Tax=Curtobacterium luteum TaxID=33881 RepID=UPI00380D2687
MESFVTVYVDDARIAARVGGLRGCWSHLFADSSDELLLFAASIGLAGEWLQCGGEPEEHFDVTERVRRAALQAGAVPISAVDAGLLVLRRVTALRMLRPGFAGQVGMTSQAESAYSLM